MIKYIFLFFTCASTSLLAQGEEGYGRYNSIGQLGALSALESAIPEDDHALIRRQMEILRHQLLYGRLGIDGHGMPISFKKETKQFIGKYLDLFFKYCTWLEGVNLHDMGLHYLPKSVGRLTQLEYLDLAENKLRFIPDELTKLPKLRTVKLKGNPVLGISPTLLAELEKRGNDYQIDDARKERFKKGYAHYEARIWFVNNLFNMFQPHLKETLFDELAAGRLGFFPNGEVREHDVKTKKFIHGKLGKIAKNVPYMTHLNLSGYDFDKVPIALKDMLRLKVLLLARNKLKSVPDFFQGLRALKTLDLSQNDFQVFPTGLHENETVETLYFANNGLVEFHMRGMNMPKLLTLDLSHNQLKSFPRERVDFPHVKTLNVSANPLEKLTGFPEIFPKLEHLDVHQCPLIALPPKYMDIVDGVDPAHLATLLTMHERVERVSLLLYLVEFEKETLMEELVRGRIGITPEGRPRTLMDVEKEFLLLNLDLIVEALPWLREINFQYMKLEEIPAALQHLHELEILDVKHNYLKTLPDFFRNYTKLRELCLSHNEFEDLPAGLEHLQSLRVLQIAHNHIRHLNPMIAKLTQLRTLSLSGNFLRTLPDALFTLKNLVVLSLTHTPLCELPPAIGEMASLKRLGLSNTQLGSLPSEIGHLKKLATLELNLGRMKTLPSTLKNLRHLGSLDLQRHALQPESDDSGMGYKEITLEFGNRAKLSPNRHLPEGGYKSEKAVYAHLDQMPLKWNREQLKEIVVPQILERKITGGEMLAEWESIWGSFNFENSAASDYLDYYMLSEEKVADGETRSNIQLMQEELLPRINGFLKTVYNMSLAEDEICGWAISPLQKPDMQNIIAVIFTHLRGAADPDQRARIFVQFVAGAIMCQTGQKNNFETVLLSLSEENDTGNMVNVESFDIQLLKLLAYEKEKIFRQITNDTDNKQSVHLYEYYKSRLSEVLGLRSSFKNFKDIHGIDGHDPYAGSLGNVLSSFYNLFNPDAFIQLILSKIATEEEVEFLRKKRKSALDRSKAEEIESFKPLRFAKIVSMMTDNGLLTQHDLRDEDDPDAERPKWEIYFEGHPHDLGSAIKPKAIEDILIHMGVCQ